MSTRSIVALIVSRTALCTLAALISACGGSSDSSSGSSGVSASLTPSLGKIQHASFEAHCTSTGQVLGSGSTDASGKVSASLSGSCTGPVMVQLVANAASTYFDEALGSSTSLPPGTKLRALLPGLPGSGLDVAVTPLTEIATRRALHAAGGVETALTLAQVLAANAAVPAQVLGANGAGIDILTPPTLWDAGTGTGSLHTTPADRYAFFLAGLARMGGTSGTPALTVMDTLADDLADGSLDGASNGGFTYTSSSFDSDRDIASNALIGFANADLQSVLAGNFTLILAAWSKSGTVLTYAANSGVTIQLTMSDIGSNSVSQILITGAGEGWFVACNDSTCPSDAVSYDAASNSIRLHNLTLQNMVEGADPLTVAAATLPRNNLAGSVTSNIANDMNTTFTPDVMTLTFTGGGNIRMRLEMNADANSKSATLEVYATGQAVNRIIYTASSPGITLTYSCNNSAEGQACPDTTTLNPTQSEFTFTGTGLPLLSNTSASDAQASIILNGTITR